MKCVLVQIGDTVTSLVASVRLFCRDEWKTQFHDWEFTLEYCAQFGICIIYVFFSILNAIQDID